MKIHIYRVTSLFTAMVVLVGCGVTSPNSAPSTGPAQSASNATQIVTSTDTPVAGSEVGEGGGGEAALVTYADPVQGFSIGYPKPWSKDSTLKEGVKFDGDGTMTVAFVMTSTKDVMTFVASDIQAFPASLSSFKQVGLNASSEVPNSVVLGFETNGISNVTGKTYAARGDRYYISLKDGRIAILTVISPVKSYDREGIRDIALTLKVTK